jgi:hypothetical protein
LCFGLVGHFNVWSINAIRATLLHFCKLYLLNSFMVSHLFLTCLYFIKIFLSIIKKKILDYESSSAFCFYFYFHFRSLSQTKHKNPTFRSRINCWFSRIHNSRNYQLQMKFERPNYKSQVRRRKIFLLILQKTYIRKNY